VEKIKTRGKQSRHKKLSSRERRPRRREITCTSGPTRWKTFFFGSTWPEASGVRGVLREWFLGDCNLMFCCWLPEGWRIPRGLSGFRSISPERTKRRGRTVRMRLRDGKIKKDPFVKKETWISTDLGWKTWLTRLVTMAAKCTQWRYFHEKEKKSRRTEYLSSTPKKSTQSWWRKTDLNDCRSADRWKNWEPAGAF
jgi:hypothetical protein